MSSSKDRMPGVDMLPSGLKRLVRRLPASTLTRTGEAACRFCPTARRISAPCGRHLSRGQLCHGRVQSSRNTLTNIKPHKPGRKRRLGTCRGEGAEAPYLGPTGAGGGVLSDVWTWGNG